MFKITHRVKIYLHRKRWDKLSSIRDGITIQAVKLGYSVSSPEYGRSADLLLTFPGRKDITLKIVRTNLIGAGAASGIVKAAEKLKGDAIFVVASYSFNPFERNCMTRTNIVLLEGLTEQEMMPHIERLGKIHAS